MAGDVICFKVAWYEYWLPVLVGLGQQCTHKLVQPLAVQLFQAVLMKGFQEYYSADLEWVVPECYESVIVPVVDNLAKADPSGQCGQTIICKVGRLYLGLSRTKAQQVWQLLEAPVARHLELPNMDLLREWAKNAQMILSEAELEPK